MFCRICGSSAFLKEPDDPQPKRGCLTPVMKQSVSDYLRTGTLNNHLVQLAFCMSRGVPVTLKLSLKNYKRIQSDIHRLEAAVKVFRREHWNSKAYRRITRACRDTGAVATFELNHVNFTAFVASSGRTICTLACPGVPATLTLSYRPGRRGGLSIFSLEGTADDLITLLNLCL